MTHTIGSSFLRAASGLVLVGSVVGCAPTDTGRAPNGESPSATSTVATGEVDRSRTELSGGGEIVTDAQWQSLGESGGNGDDRNNGNNGNNGDDGDDNSCSATFDNCPSFYPPAKAGVRLSVEAASQEVEVGAARLSNEHGGVFAVTDNTCTDLEVSEGTGECTIIVEFSPQQPGQYYEQLAIDIPSHGVTHTIDLERNVSAPATALPTAPTDSATGFTDPPERESPDPVPPGTGEPPVNPPNSQMPATDVPVGEP